MPEEQKPKYTLLTNISFVQLNKVPIPLRLWAHAVLIVEDYKEQAFGPDLKIRGFKTDSYNEIFSLYLTKESFPFKLDTKVSDPHIVFISDNQPEPKPLFAGTLLELNDGNSLYLDIECREKPLDVQEFDDILKVWEALPHKVEDYWQAPYMPTTGQKRTNGTTRRELEAKYGR